MPLLALGGCGAAGSVQYGVSGDLRYPGLSCAPFARVLTGVDLHGDADSWWSAAEGRYARIHSPVVGSILVLQAVGRLPYGHVAVVSGMHDPRSIDVIQANWVPGELERDQPVVDVSPDNDWTLVRVWYAPAGVLGAHAYPAYGFIVPDLPASHDTLARAAPAAAERAASGG